MDIPGGSLTVLGIFLMGLGLNLTPCVYPMISVTVSVFGGQKEVHHWRAFGKSIIYVLGIATMYSVLGVIAALTGELFGALLQNRWVLLGIAIALLILALSMFGIYTFQMPTRLINKIRGQHKMNLLGIYLSGLFVGIFAAPCIGPPIIALLAFVGTRGEPAFAFMIFFVLSLGLGAPYVILGTFSSLLHRLPKSGVWMVWVERLFGMILLSLAAFYALLAFRPGGLVLWLPVSIIATGAYLGFIEKAGDEELHFRWFKRSIGTAAILIGFLLPLLGPKESLVWAHYTPELLAETKQSKKPVIMDFYADWCLPCHELDQFTNMSSARNFMLKFYFRELQNFGVGLITDFLF